jgi:hypothetical protein
MLAALLAPPRMGARMRHRSLVLPMPQCSRHRALAMLTLTAHWLRLLMPPCSRYRVSAALA